MEKKAKKKNNETRKFNYGVQAIKSIHDLQYYFLLQAIKLQNHKRLLYIISFYTDWISNYPLPEPLSTLFVITSMLTSILS